MQMAPFQPGAANVAVADRRGGRSGHHGVRPTVKSRQLEADS